MNDDGLHPNYAANLEQAREFEDFVADVLYERAGMVIHVYRSRRHQVAYGECRVGLEIKLDRKWRDTGNLFIETEERHNTSVPFKPAGINGGCWLYVIGDYVKFWLFAAAALRLMAEQPALYRPVMNGTAKGFLLPIGEADRWAARIFVFTPPASGGAAPLPAEADHPWRDLDDGVTPAGPDDVPF